MRSDKLAMSLLLDCYGELLTEKQRDCFDLYCNQDLTLAEIAELSGTSRQSVYDAVSRAQAQLLRLEEVTHSLKRQQQSADMAAALERASLLLRQNGAGSIPEAAACMDSIVSLLKE